MKLTIVLIIFVILISVNENNASMYQRYQEWDKSIHNWICRDKLKSINSCQTKLNATRFSLVLNQQQLDICISEATVSHQNLEFIESEEKSCRQDLEVSQEKNKEIQLEATNLKQGTLELEEKYNSCVENAQMNQKKQDKLTESTDIKSYIYLGISLVFTISNLLSRVFKAHYIFALMPALGAFAFFFDEKINQRSAITLQKIAKSFKFEMINIPFDVSPLTCFALGFGFLLIFGSIFYFWKRISILENQNVKSNRRIDRILQKHFRDSLSKEQRISTLRSQLNLKNGNPKDVLNFELRGYAAMIENQFSEMKNELNAVKNQLSMMIEDKMKKEEILAKEIPELKEIIRENSIVGESQPKQFQPTSNPEVQPEVLQVKEENILVEDFKPKKIIEEFNPTIKLKIPPTKPTDFQSKPTNFPQNKSKSTDPVPQNSPNFQSILKSKKWTINEIATNISTFNIEDFLNSLILIWIERDWNSKIINLIKGFNF
jgi:hypothetical protein